jgi:hypothetical protein
MPPCKSLWTLSKGFQLIIFFPSADFLSSYCKPILACNYLLLVSLHSPHVHCGFISPKQGWPKAWAIILCISNSNFHHTTFILRTGLRFQEKVTKTTYPPIQPVFLWHQLGTKHFLGAKDTEGKKKDKVPALIVSWAAYHPHIPHKRCFEKSCVVPGIFLFNTNSFHII